MIYCFFALYILASGTLFASQNEVVKEAKRFAKDHLPVLDQNTLHPQDFLSPEEREVEFDGDSIKKKISNDQTPEGEIYQFLNQDGVKHNRFTIDEKEYFFKHSEEITENKESQSGPITVEEPVYTFETCKKGGNPYPLSYIRTLNLDIAYEPEQIEEFKTCSGHKEKKHYRRKNRAYKKADEKEYELSKDPSIKTHKVRVYGGGIFSKYTVKWEWIHSDNAKSCGSFTTGIQIAKPEKFEINGENWVYEDNQAVDLSKTPQCTLIDHTCLDSEDFKLFYGKEVKRQCWKERLSFLCLPEQTNECTFLKEKNCDEISRKCLRESSYGCSLWEITYKCLSNIKRKIDQFGGMAYLEELVDVEYEPNYSFAEVASKLAVFDEIKNEISNAQSLDPSQIEIFPGKKRGCEKTIADHLVYDCCFSLGGLATEIKLAKCSADEIALAEQRGKGLCHYVGVKEEKFLGIKTKDIHVFCCFSSKLSRVFQEQAKKQLGFDWGVASHPNCSGIKIDDVSCLDFSKLDLSEVYEDLMGKTEGLEQKLENFKNRLVEQVNREKTKMAN